MLPLVGLITKFWACSLGDETYTKLVVGSSSFLGELPALMDDLQWAIAVYLSNQYIVDSVVVVSWVYERNKGLRKV